MSMYDYVLVAGILILLVGGYANSSLLSVVNIFIENSYLYSGCYDGVLTMWSP
jgi:hypothetical protein